MFLFQNIDNQITQQLRDEEVAGKKERSPSGKLSASMLGEPVQWQILKTLGIGSRQVDDYLLRKFEVGRDTEDWFMRRAANNILERQKFVEYRGAIGYMDALVSAEIALTGQVKTFSIPLEVKSTSNAKFKRILAKGDADEMHKLQAGFYALAIGAPYYGITYIATDDRRTHTWVFAAEDVKENIDTIIDIYNTCLKDEVVPVFVERYGWQAGKEYNKYPDWQALNANEIKIALDTFYPTAWEDYKNAQKKSQIKVNK